MTPASHLSPDGSFIVEDYNRAPLFSSFLPGIAGKSGVPLWAFYVNRGQAMTSFGVRNKDGAIMEFFPADRAYQNVTLRGFRTFLKIRRGGKTLTHEPFQPTLDKKVSQRLIVSPHEVAVEETHAGLGLRVRAVMFTLPGAPLAALMRSVVVENLSASSVDVSFVDGPPLLLSCGLNLWCVKYMSRTMEAFAVVDAAGDAPFLRLKVLPADSEKVVPVVAGHFFAGRLENGRALTPLVDARAVFGGREDFVRPEAFFDGTPVPRAQRLGNRNPAGLLTGRVRIAGKGAAAWHSLYGRADTLEDMRAFVKGATPAFFREKRSENAALIRRITAPAFAATALPALDAYVRQSFLDNGLRGGFPSILPGGKVVYLFGRKHGDPERDYNEFFLQDTPWSEGNGDFRDMLQNRRVDLFFRPAVGDRNVRYFFGLIQADGYNPLVLRNTRFFVRDAESLKALWRDKALPGDPLSVAGKPFKFAELWSFLKGNGATEAAADVLALCDEAEDAEFEKGYWSDHWTYLLDLLENFRAVYPERLAALLLDDASYPFYDGAHAVQPRAKKYVLTDRGVRQYGAVAYNKEKDRLIKSRAAFPHRARAAGGKGAPVLTTLLGKIMTLVLNKLASLDPFAAGVEMEADRPGWCDALNGLPGLFGSSVNETLELKRLVRFTLDALREAGREGAVSLPSELTGLWAALKPLVESRAWDADPFRFWEDTHNAKEAYRDSVFFGFDGSTAGVPLAALRDFLTGVLALLDKAAGRCRDGNQVVTYYINEAVAWEALDSAPSPLVGEGRGEGLNKKCVRVTSFKRMPLPPFLEGFVHALRVAETPEEARALHEAVRGTALFDRPLGMYRLNVPLGEAFLELGRVGIFPYGWLENGSIFLHMHYKYALEMARRGLLADFYKDWKNLLVPFRDPRQYGRSILENASFIACSGYKDKEDHGRAFVARLSGSTVEFLHLWSFLLFGEAPFAAGDKGGLTLSLRPSLAAELFTARPRTVFPDGPDAPGVELPKGALAFRFLGKTLAVYHNPARRDTFGPGAVKPVRHELTFNDGRRETVEGAVLPDAPARALRDGRVARLDVHFA